MRYRRAFTLAEVLIALALLGVIAALIIPKILQSNQNERRIAITKEMFAALSDINLRAYQANDLVHNSTQLSDFIKQRMNLQETTGTNYAAPGLVCSSGTTLCFSSPTGAVIGVLQDQTYLRNSGSGEDKHAWNLFIYPDNQVVGLNVFLYADGRVLAADQVRVGILLNYTLSGPGVVMPLPIPNQPPEWFHW